MSIKLTKAASAVAVVLLSINAYGAGFQIHEQSATGLGRAFAGEAAIADNASVISRNPAAMTLFKRIEVSGSLIYIDPQIDITIAEGASEGSKAKDVAPTAFVPSGYLVYPLSDRIAVGLGMFANYGFATDYPTDFAYGTDAGKTELAAININPSIGFRVNEHLSVGAGVSLVYGDATLQRRFGALNPSDPSAELIKLSGDTYEFGWNLGVLYEVNDDHRFGLSYRAETVLDFEGDFTDGTGGIIIDGEPGDTITGDLPLVTPAIAEFSGFHQLTPTFAMHYSVLWTQWSKFTEIKATSDGCEAGVCLEKSEEFDDNFRLSLGATYQYSPTIVLRAGFAFDEQGGEATLSIPDTDRYWYSAGLTYHVSRNLSLDGGITYLYGKSGSFEESGATFDAENDAWLFGSQFNYRF